MKFSVKSLAFACVAALVCAFSASAQKEKPLPKGLPPFGPERPLQAPKVQQTKLENGLTVWLVPEPGFPKISYAIATLGGYAADPKDRPGLSDLLAATIDQGTKTRNSRQIAEQMQNAGGDIGGNVSRDAFFVSAGVLASKADEGLAILADILQNATFPDAEVDLARRNLLDSLQSQEADPHFLANRALAKVMFGNGPYSIISPTKESLTAATPADLRAEYARRFRPDQALLVAVGDFNAEKMLAAVRQQFGAWRAPASAVEGAPAPPSTADLSHAIYFVPRPDSVQTTLEFAAFGPKRSDPDYPAAVVANAIYGGTFGSRLTANIREDKGYTYSPGSFLQAFRSAGALRTQADVRNAVTGPSLNEIFYEMNRMATTSPTDRELEQAKRYLVGIEAIRMQANSAVAGELAGLWIQGLPPEEISAYNNKIAAMTSADVDAAARKYFPASRTAIVAVGEEKTVRTQLALFGLPIHPAP
ncbi:MAG TPA: pitrilysin family protein [Candidatus Acidoferrales bacterium]|nr:pitrilysin family protein [Candidatus Acidoferrales bacterium]